ncbi:MAG: hypothetical protein MJY59_01020 [Bacteroidaceae bacterium]|nr:hypothetical protein [Bacteroidaceae bacterium]
MRRNNTEPLKVHPIRLSFRVMTCTFAPCCVQSACAVPVTPANDAGVRRPLPAVADGGTRHIGREGE